ncbi:MAG: phosphoribosylamine--glycine ligase [Chloroflexota bacterium]|nr:phosphoribosylamine--glycine ligase [Chloroflexota bacterium]MDE2883537.1 phosphoribosylamine--glycine ligase [Chloroflexota bacterium]
MRVLVVGSGAREHAILWKLAQSPRNPELFAVPGNAGTAGIATNLPIAVTDLDALIGAAGEYRIDLTIVGPELPLTAGIVDRFREAGLRIFGPTQAAARIEGSKSFARGVMRDAGAPTPAFAVFDDAGAAREYVRSQGAPIVIKADGLAAGKGVVVAQGVDEALEAVDDAMVGRAFGASGERVVIEQCLVGQELSVFCFTDGEYVSPLVPACDYKRVFDGDQGPNTGGMGGYSPPPWWDAAMERQIRETCIEPVIREMARQRSPFTGVLYGGLMLTDEGPFIIEFNARLGDPEAQLILPRMKNDLLDVVEAALDGTLPSMDLRWSDECAVGVVLVPGGYPGAHETGKRIEGLLEAGRDAVILHAGTALSDGGTLVTGGSRTMTVVGRGVKMADARAHAYVAAEAVTFEGKHYRTDIASFAAV